MDAQGFHVSPKFSSPPLSLRDGLCRIGAHQFAVCFNLHSCEQQGSIQTCAHWFVTVRSPDVCLGFHRMAYEGQDWNSVLFCVLMVCERVEEPMPLRDLRRRIGDVTGRQQVSDLRTG